MKTEQQIKDIMNAPYRKIEKALSIKIRNGQTVEGIRKALAWVLE